MALNILGQLSFSGLSFGKLSRHHFVICKKNSFGNIGGNGSAICYLLHNLVKQIQMEQHKLDTHETILILP